MASHVPAAPWRVLTGKLKEWEGKCDESFGAAFQSVVDAVVKVAKAVGNVRVVPRAARRAHGTTAPFTHRRLLLVEWKKRFRA